MKTILNSIGLVFITVIAILGFCIELPIKLGSCILTILVYIIGLILYPILDRFDISFSWYRPIYEYSISTKFLIAKVVNYYGDITTNK